MTFRIPADVAEHLHRLAEVLNAHKRQMDFLYGLWADEDPDPANGDFWAIRMDSPDADKLRGNLGQAAEFLNWLANFTDKGAST